MKFKLESFIKTRKTRRVSGNKQMSEFRVNPKTLHDVIIRLSSNTPKNFNKTKG